MAASKFNLLVFMAMVIAFMMFHYSVADTQHVVGGDIGWIIPNDPNFYNDWASKETFTVGDTLQFNFNSGAHDVAKVLKDGFDQCNDDGASTIITDGPGIFNLTESGEQYYICRFNGHCMANQKLVIIVVGS
uniref:umecyanin-like n=1 Tax=Erigeron canadensis TaxID=72917 RepID=UPI001CB89A6B|nr:umecyanin-like [Erigeron canadensis]